MRNLGNIVGRGWGRLRLLLLLLLLLQVLVAPPHQLRAEIANINVGEAALVNKKQHDNEVLFTQGAVLEGLLCEPYLDHGSNRCQREHTVIKDFGGTVKHAGQNGCPMDTHWLASQKNQEKLLDLV